MAKPTRLFSTPGPVRHMLLAATLTFAAYLAACGQRGPLYLPDEGTRTESQTQKPLNENNSAEEDDDKDDEGNPHETTPRT